MATSQWRASERAASLVAILLAGLVRAVLAQSDPACPWLVACEYEAPAFTIRVVDQQTGQPLSDVHGIACWVIYGGHGRRGLLMALEAVSGPDGQLSFQAWGPIRNASQGLLPGLDPVITLFRPGYRAKLVHNETPVQRPDTARLHPFAKAGETFTLDQLTERSPLDLVSALWEAAEPVDGGNVSRHDPEPFRQIYVRRWKRVKAEAERLPRLPEVQRLLWQLDTTIRIFATGDTK